MKYKTVTIEQDRTFLAALQGIDYGKAVSTHKGATSKPLLRGDEIFGNPEDYKHLSDDEKRALTEQMKKKVNSLRLGTGSIKEG